MKKRYKPNKQWFYLRSFAGLLVPRIFFTSRLTGRLESLEKREDKAYILDRVNYYNKLSASFRLPESAGKLKELNRKSARTMYFLDSARIVRWFDGDFRWCTAFGDVNYVAPVPSVAKSRPLCPDNANNVLLKLNRYRHYNFLNDPVCPQDKLPSAVFRADIGDPEKQNRVEFMQRYFGSAVCNCGSIRNMPGLPAEWLTPKMPVGEMLKYRFILAIEGNDVATNLKWVMSSNSVAVMPSPTCETWFMEGRLLPDVHYVEIRPDFSDLEEKVDYYNRHPEKVAAIVAQANRYCRQFLDAEREDLIALGVMKKYFELSGQM